MKPMLAKAVAKGIVQVLKYVYINISANYENKNRRL